MMQPTASVMVRCRCEQRFVVYSGPSFRVMRRTPSRPGTLPRASPPEVNASLETDNDLLLVVIVLRTVAGSLLRLHPWGPLSHVRCPSDGGGACPAGSATVSRRTRRSTWRALRDSLDWLRVAWADPWRCRVRCRTGRSVQARGSAQPGEEEAVRGAPFPYAPASHIEQAEARVNVREN